MLSQLCEVNIIFRISWCMLNSFQFCSFQNIIYHHLSSFCLSSLGIFCNCCTSLVFTLLDERKKIPSSHLSFHALLRFSLEFSVEGTSNVSKARRNDAVSCTNYLWEIYIQSLVKSNLLTVCEKCFLKRNVKNSNSVYIYFLILKPA